MAVSLAMCGLALRAGLALRRSRQGGVRRTSSMRGAHLRLAKPAVAMLLIGFVGGPVSAALLRDWEPFHSFHAWLGVLAASLFAAAAVLGRRIERGRSRAFDRHALLGVVALLFGAVAAVAGFVLLP
jgi:hypothetical protein